MSTTDKHLHAYDMAELALTRGLTPVAASITGSRLRGLDHAGSDIDGLVLVAEKLTRARSWTYRTARAGSANKLVEVQVQSLDGFVDRLSRSVPYVEFLHSPFLLVDPRLRTYLSSLRVNRYMLDVHARGFATHALNRAGGNQTQDKAMRNALVALYVSTTLSPLIPRSLLSDYNNDTHTTALSTWLNTTV